MSAKIVKLEIYLSYGNDRLDNEYICDDDKTNFQNVAHFCEHNVKEILVYFYDIYHRREKNPWFLYNKVRIQIKTIYSNIEEYDNEYSIPCENIKTLIRYDTLEEIKRIVINEIRNQEDFNFRWKDSSPSQIFPESNYNHYLSSDED